MNNPIDGNAGPLLMAALKRLPEGLGVDIRLKTEIDS